MDTSLLFAALLTVAIYTLLWKENPVYRFVEHLFVGTTMGYFIVMAVRSINSVGVTEITNGNYIYVLSFVLGAMLYARFLGKQFVWMNRYPVSVMVGSTIGLSLRGTPQTIFIGQLSATLKPLIGSGSLMTDFNNIVIFFSFLFSLLYFIFTFEMHRQAKGVSKMGRYFMMIYFGALYGNVIIHRSSLLIARMQFLLFDLLQL